MEKCFVLSEEMGYGGGKSTQQSGSLISSPQPALLLSEPQLLHLGTESIFIHSTSIY